MRIDSSAYCRRILAIATTLLLLFGSGCGNGTTQPTEPKAKAADAPVVQEKTQKQKPPKCTLEGTTNEQISILTSLSDDPTKVAEAVPILHNAMFSEEETVRLAAENGFEKLGAASVKHLKPFLDPKQQKNFEAASIAIRAIGPPARELLPDLQKGLESDNRAVKFAAAFALENFGEAAKPALPRIIELLSDKDMNTRLAAMRAITSMGPAAVEAQDKLVELLEKDVISARGWAAIALGSIGSTEKHDVAELLKPKLEAFTQVEKLRALKGLAYMGPKASSVEAEVRALMLDSKKSVMPQAALTLWKITGEAEPSLEVLGKTLQTHSFKGDALGAIAEFGPAGAPLVPAVTKELDFPEAPIREYAATTLMKIGPPAKSALKKLKAVAENDNDYLVRDFAKRAIAAINADHKGQEKASETPEK